MVSLPIKNIAYLAAPIYVLIQVLRGDHLLLLRTAWLAMTVLFVTSVSLFWDNLRGNDVNVPGMMWGILTYLPLLIVLVERPDKLMDRKRFALLLRVLQLAN